MEAQQLSLDYDIVPAHLAVQAMRDSGYKNAAYALAELMDNSIQAGATQVELLCGEETRLINTHRRSRIHKIGVLDDGGGMDEEVLQLALQFGNGTHLDPEDQKGIGKFGMGLPNSSISQCKRVDVWSWQDGVEDALHTYIDIDKIRNKEQNEVPTPQAKPVPSLWRTAGKHYGPTGTLVVWSSLDRVMWKTARAIIRNSERYIGRMYRRFLDDGQVSIRLCALDVDHPDQEADIDREAEPNDPLYLMSKTSCPYGDEPMFELWGEPTVKNIEFRGETHPVEITFSVAREEARDRSNAGDTDYGRHAGKNIGVSITRAGRELELDESWVIQYDSRERWWGVQVEFPPALDDLFGLSNNKQSARNFRQLDIGDLIEGEETEVEAKERLMNEGDPSGPLLDISEHIDNNLSVLRKHIKAQREGSRSNGEKRHQDTEAEERATQQTDKRNKEGYTGESDEGDEKSPEELKEEREKDLTDFGVSRSEAEAIAGTTVDRGLRYVFSKASLETAAFFSVKLKSGTVHVRLNTNHPAYDELIEVLEDNSSDDDTDNLHERLNRARNGLKLLLMAWARYEDELSGERRHKAQEARHDWGRIARQFLIKND